MKVRVLLFASFAEIAGWREREVEIEAGATVADVLALLRRRFLQVLPESARPLISRNRVHARPEELVEDGDEIAVFPPVSGGQGPTEHDRPGQGPTEHDRPGQGPTEHGRPGQGPTEPDGTGQDPAEDERARIVDHAIDVASLSAIVRHPSCGAVVVFEGVVREQNDGERVVAVEYEAYVDMAVGVLREIIDEVELRLPGTRLAAAHRTGRLPVGETSVVVAVAAPHRREAFAACRLAMDRIKESLPVWKKEETTGEHRWISP